MGTLSTTLALVRIRIKDQYKNEFTDGELIGLTIEIMDQVFEELRRLESNLVLQTVPLVVTAATDTYPLTGIGNIVSGGVWIDPDHPLTMLYQPTLEMTAGEPQFFTRMPSGEIKFTPVPDKEYTISITNCLDYAPPTEDTLATYDFPWSGLWDRAIYRAVVFECLSILERNVGVAIAQASDAWDEATINTFNHGKIRRTQRGRLFYGL